MKSLYLVSSRPLTAPSRAPVDFHYHRSSSLLPTKVPVTESTRFGRRGGRRTQFLMSAFGHSGGGESRRLRMNDLFASISRNNETAQTSSVGNPPLSVPASPSSVGSPLFWIGVGVGFSVLFTWVANYLKVSNITLSLPLQDDRYDQKYAMQQAFKAMMAPLEQQKAPFGNPTMFPGSMFPAAPGFPSTNRTPPPRATHQPVVSTDVVATKVEPASEVETPTSSKEIKSEDDATEESKKYAFVDVAPEDVSSAGSAEGFRYPDEVRPPNGSAINQDKSDTFKQSDSQKSPLLSVEALEKMMEDPTVQKMVYPYLPEEMRNPSTFKWMMQNPQYREQLQDMLNNMGGSSEWDGQMLNSLKNFDLSSPEVKQQFDQIGLTPEEVISKIMADPDVAMSFQNPKVQAAIIDCSQNPLNIRKYQDDQEVMDVFNKISELFPGATGSY